MIHIVMSRAIDFVALAHDVARDLAPTHVLLELARRLPVIFHQPGKVPFQLTFADGNPLAIPTLTPTATSAPAESRIDGLRGRLISSATYWALARHTMALAGPDDTVFATGEDVGIPLATARAGMHDPPRLLVTVHNIRRPRVSVAFRLFNTLQHVSEWVTPAPAQGAYLRSLGIPDTHIHMPPEQTDTLFYTPLGANTPPAALNPRPLIVSVGLERRDYRTLAAATIDLDLDVRISGASPDAQVIARAFPETMPPNMTRRFYSWTELRDLYRQADLVVVPMFENPCVAGITTFLEGLAHEKPVIVSRTSGMSPYLFPKEEVDMDICLAVPPENPAALRTAITDLLQKPATASSLAVHGRKWLLAHHTANHWVSAMVEILTNAHVPAS